MEDERPAKKRRTRTGCDGAVDLISHLPDCVLAVVLSFLSTKDAARTSLLSSRWRHLWSTSPLYLHDDSIWSKKIYARRRFGSITPWTRDKSWRFQTISHILSSHRGSVHSFSLIHMRFRENLPVVEGWFRILAQKYIQEIKLCLPGNAPLDERRIPASLLTYESLKKLVLKNCLFPDTNEASLKLINLRELDLQETGVTEEGLCSILSSCTALQILSISDGSIRRIHVRSQSLETLSVEGCYDLTELFIEDAPNLRRLLRSCSLARKVWTKIVSTRTPKLEMLGSLSTQIKRLELGKSVFKMSSDQRTNVSLSSSLVRSLKTLAVEVNFSSQEEAKMLVYLLRCFPRLEKLHIRCSHQNSANNGALDYWELVDPIDCIDRHLKMVKLRMYDGLVGELNFAKFLIAKARVLKAMRIECKTKCSKRWVSKQRSLLHLRKRASLDAQTTFAKHKTFFGFGDWRKFDLTSSDPFDTGSC